MPEEINNKAIILFDGVCNFCNSTINLIMRKDKKDHFRFAPLQSETGKQLMKKFGIDSRETDSIVLVENDRAYTRSGAALKISRKLNWPFPFLYGFIIVPPVIRNAVYDWIARNRYKWFGKKESCMIPTPEMKNKFIS